MPLLYTFTDRTTCLVEHERGKYSCPLFFPEPTRKVCPVRHKNHTKKGCTVMMPTSICVRLRYALDRNSRIYRDLYRQRTAVERINSQAYKLGVERPHLRNGNAIANLSTLIYTPINCASSIACDNQSCLLASERNQSIDWFRFFGPSPELVQIHS